MYYKGHLVPHNCIWYIQLEGLKDNQAQVSIAIF